MSRPSSTVSTEAASTRGPAAQSPAQAGNVVAVTNLPMNADPDVRPVFIFFDNSNIWIEGARCYAARRANADPTQTFAFKPDPRWRVNVGRLLNVLVSERNFQRGVLYGVSSRLVDGFA